MTETIVELENVSVLRVRADWNGPGPAAAFALLKSRLASLKGRRFYGVFRKTAEGEEYYACVARVEGDDPASMEIETGEIPGSWYARRTIQNWERDVTQIAIQFKDMIRVLGEHVDRGRPEIEFYRSQAELRVFVPVRSPGGALLTPGEPRSGVSPDREVARAGRRFGGTLRVSSYGHTSSGRRAPRRGGV